jgi:hypothetical protein
MQSKTEKYVKPWEAVFLLRKFLKSGYAICISEAPDDDDNDDNTDDDDNNNNN